MFEWRPEGRSTRPGNGRVQLLICQLASECVLKTFTFMVRVLVKRKGGGGVNVQCFLRRGGSRVKTAREAGLTVTQQKEEMHDGKNPDVIVSVCGLFFFPLFFT